MHNARNIGSLCRTARTKVKYSNSCIATSLSVRTRRLATALEQLPPKAREKTEPRPLQETFQSLGPRVQGLNAAGAEEDSGSAADVFDADFTAHTVAQPGDYVYLRGRGIEEHGAVLSILPGGDFQACLSNGEKFEHSKRYGVFLLPRVFDQQTVMRAAEGDQMGLVELIREMRTFRKKSDEALFKVRLAAHGELYKRFRSDDPSKWTSVSLQDAAQFVKARLRGDVGITSEQILLATYIFMLESSDYFALTSKNDLFRVAPQDYIRLFREVNGWMEKKDTRMTSFIEKAKGIVRHSRKIRKESANVEGIISVPDKITFSEDDQKIITFLRQSLSRTRILQHSPYDATVCAICLALGLPIEDIVTNAATLLLLELGASPPGGDIHAEVFALDAWKTVDASKVDQEGASLVAGHQAGQAGSPPRFNDGVDHIRHDWGDQPVYVIDADDAQELDDGVSIEHLPDGTEWLHVHVADPTAVLRPHHSLAAIAKERGTSLYFVDKTFAMLPKTLTSAFSLGAASRDNPIPVLTFSTKLNAEGHIAAYTVRPSFIRNVKKVSYNLVDRVLGYSEPVLEWWQEVAPEHVATPKASNPTLVLSDADVLDLRRMRQAARRSEAGRIVHGAAVSNWNQLLQTSIEPKVLPTPPFPPTTPIHYKGFPKVSVIPTDHISPKAGGARAMVAEFMILACRNAACFARDNSIPLLYRKAKISNTDLYFSLRDPKTGSIPLSKEWLQVMPQTALSATPAHNDWLTFKEPYTRVTSPLRRYCDLLAHWQLKAFSGGQALPFSLEKLKDMAALLGWRETHTNRLGKDNDEFWALNGFRRLVEAGKVDRSKLKGLRAVITGEGKMHATGVTVQRNIHLSQLALRGVVVDLSTEENQALELGAVITVNVHEFREGRDATINCLLSR